MDSLFDTFDFPAPDHRSEPAKCLCDVPSAHDDYCDVGGLSICVKCGVVVERSGPSAQACVSSPDVFNFVAQTYDASCNLGTAIAPSSRGNARMKKQHSWMTSMTHSARKIYQSLSKMEAVARSSQISQKNIDVARNFYREMTESGGMPKGREKDAMTAACLYMSLKSTGVPRTLSEINGMFVLDALHPNVRGSVLLTKAVKRCEEVLCLDVRESTPTDYIKRFASKLGIDGARQDMARTYAVSESCKNVISEHSPDVVAAACLWLCKPEDTNMESLVAVSHVSHTSIQVCSRKLRSTNTRHTCSNVATK